jgi:ABC-type transport system involved in multi-copper enzyme maturation permease subunit
MTAAAATSPRVGPFGLARAELLKLRKRRGLFWTVAALTVLPMVVAYGILAILHATNPAHHGPAGGVANLGHGMSLLVLLGSIAAIIVGANGGADDVTSGVFRELVITGRSRLALFWARVPGGLAFLLAFIAIAYAISALVSGLAHGYLIAPSVTLLIESALWVIAETAFYFVLGLGLASLIGSRAYTIGILFAWRLPIGHILAAIGALGAYRAVVPDVPFAHLAPSAVEEYVNDLPHVGVSLETSVAVLLLWAVVAAGVGAWRTATRDA